MKKIIILFSGINILLACNNNKEQKEKIMEQVSAEKTDTAVHAFANVKMDNKKDLSCGMPLTAGVEDTAHYKGKMYGFCSKECKDDFLKSPEANLAAAKK